VTNNELWGPQFDSLAVDREVRVTAVSDIWPDGGRVDHYKLPHFGRGLPHRPGGAG